MKVAFVVLCSPCLFAFFAVADFLVTNYRVDGMDAAEAVEAVVVVVYLANAVA